MKVSVVRSFFFCAEILLFVGICRTAHMGNHTPLEHFSLSLKAWNNPHAWKALQSVHLMIEIKYSFHSRVTSPFWKCTVSNNVSIEIRARAPLGILLISQHVSSYCKPFSRRGGKIHIPSARTRNVSVVSVWLLTKNHIKTSLFPVEDPCHINAEHVSNAINSPRRGLSLGAAGLLLRGQLSDCLVTPRLSPRDPDRAWAKERKRDFKLAISSFHTNISIFRFVPCKETVWVFTPRSGVFKHYFCLHEACWVFPLLFTQIRNQVCNAT